MSSLFKRILIPVDFSSKTDVAVNQASELACISGSTIHLLHIVKPLPIWKAIPHSNKSQPSSGEKVHLKEITAKLEKLQSGIEASVPNCKVITYIREGNVYRNIQLAAWEIKPQIIVVGKNRSQNYFSLINCICPNGLAKSTGYPVLTVMQNTDDTKIKTIVVPVGSFIPSRKVHMAIELAKKFRAAIHLITIPTEIDREETNGNSFLETYRILKTALNGHVEHHVLKGNNLPKAILEYSRCVSADLILVNPWLETKISNFTRRHINDTLSRSSKLKILSIEPYFRGKLPSG